MRTDDVFSAIANPVRRQILEMLCDNPLPAGEIARGFALNRPAISEHLQVLRSVHLVTEEVRGRQRFYHLNASALAEVGEWLHPFERYWKRRVQALKNVLGENEETK